jgi:hypothetical protein
MRTEYKPRVTPWGIEEDDFHQLSLLDEKIKFLLNYAILAPSGRNTQPWRFKLQPDGVLVYADASRSLAAADPDNRELNISIGAALMNLRVAAARFGLSCEVKYEAADPTLDLRASVKISTPRTNYNNLEDVFPALTKRHTNRRPYHARSLNEAVVWKLGKIAAGKKAGLMIITDKARQEQIAHLIARGARIQLSNAKFRKELAAWIRSNFAHEGDGISADGLGLPDFISWSGPWLVKTLYTGRRRGKADSKLAASAAALVLLHGEDTLESLLEAGELLEHFLLMLTTMRLHCSFFNQPVEVQELRSEVRSMLALSDLPQLLFRIGYASPVVRPMPRRPLESVLIP